MDRTNVKRSALLVVYGAIAGAVFALAVVNRSASAAPSPAAAAAAVSQPADEQWTSPSNEITDFSQLD